MAVNWDYFDKFESLINKYMPRTGQGETIASQAVTAVNKLIYKWYNDGDVFDNTGVLEGWCNDLSSYANWLIKYTDKAGCLNKVFNFSYTHCNSEYEDLLKELADSVLDAEWLKSMENPAVGSIYECDGPFHFVDSYEEDEYDDDDC